MANLYTDSHSMDLEIGNIRGQFGTNHIISLYSNSNYVSSSTLFDYNSPLWSLPKTRGSFNRLFLPVYFKWLIYYAAYSSLFPQEEMTQILNLIQGIHFPSHSCFYCPANMLMFLQHRLCLYNKKCDELQKYQGIQSFMQGYIVIYITWLADTVSIFFFLLCISI